MRTIKEDIADEFCRFEKIDRKIKQTIDIFIVVSKRHIFILNGKIII